MFLTVLEAWKSKIKVPADLVSSARPFPDSETNVFSLCAHMAEEVRELSGVFFIRAIIPLMT